MFHYMPSLSFCIIKPITKKSASDAPSLESGHPLFPKQCCVLLAAVRGHGARLRGGQLRRLGRHPGRLPARYSQGFNTVPGRRGGEEIPLYPTDDAGGEAGGGLAPALPRPSNPARHCCPHQRRHIRGVRGGWAGLGCRPSARARPGRPAWGPGR